MKNLAMFDKERIQQDFNKQEPNMVLGLGRLDLIFKA